MNESLVTERQLFNAYEIVFEVLLNGLIAAVVLLFIAAIVLIILCCRQTRAIARQRDAELAAACEEQMRKGETNPAQSEGSCRERTQRPQSPNLDSLSSVRSFAAIHSRRHRRSDSSEGDRLLFPE